MARKEGRATWGPCWGGVSCSVWTVWGSQLLPVGARCFPLPKEGPKALFTLTILMDIKNGTITTLKKGTNDRHNGWSSELILLYNVETRKGRHTMSPRTHLALLIQWCHHTTCFQCGIMFMCHSNVYFEYKPSISARKLRAGGATGCPGCGSSQTQILAG